MNRGATPAPQIQISPVDGDEFEVVVSGHRVTRHRVRVAPSHLERFAPPGTRAVRLLEESFRFLLEREPNTSILSRFDLSVIERYFPDYTAEIRRRLR